MFILEKLGILHLYQRVISSFIHGLVRYCDLHNRKKLTNESSTFFYTGTRFRPLSLDVPKPLFPVAGLPLIQHHIEACVQLEECKEILLIGSYQASQLQQFIMDMQREYHIIIRWDKYYYDKLFIYKTT